jgi:protein-disulfide isomerase
MKFNHFTRLSLVVVGIALTGCQATEKLVDGVVEQSLERIIKKKREEAKRAEEGPPLAERMKNPITVDVKNAPMKGAQSAEVVVVEFSDFECPFCTRVLPTVDQVMKAYEGKVALAFRHNPLPFHKQAGPAAQASMAAHRQGKFWEMHDKLFANQRGLNEKAYTQFAKDLGLDLKKFQKDFSDAEIAKMIEADANFARSNGAGGTPSFFIGKREGDSVKGVLLVGAQPFEKFKEVIDAYLGQGTAAAGK